MEYVIIIAKLVGVLLLSFVFGLERQRSHKPVGFGTFTFVALGACALGILAVSEFVENGFVLLGAIVTGIGFLGAGALIKNTDKVFGFTTAAAIWVFAIIGLCVGIGQYVLSGVLYVLVWSIVFADRLLASKGIGSYQKKVIITAKMNVQESVLKKYFDDAKVSLKLLSVHIDKVEKTAKLTYLVEGSRDSLNSVMQLLVRDDSVRSCSVE